MSVRDGCILVTGGAGYVGSHALVVLLEAGYSVVVLDNLSNSTFGSVTRVQEMTGQSIPTYNCDLCDKKGVEDIFSKHKISGVIHFASLKAVGMSVEIPLVYYRQNLVGTINLLDVMKEHGVYNFIFSSSATVYGDPKYLPYDEKHPTGSCTNPYGRTKYFIECILRDLCAAEKEWNIIILRYFNPAGAHPSGIIGEAPIGDPHNLMPNIAQVATGKRKEVLVLGGDYDTPDGTGVRDYLHVVDLASGHIEALKKLDEKCGLKTYNLGTGKPHSVLEMIKAFEKTCGKKIPYRIVERRAGDLPTFYADPSLAHKELNWKAERSLQHMCEDLWRWQSMNPNNYN
ncbi:hypothetical protein ACJMK2_041810 [Sinanodonta woodiana]|uniref:UDP-glucose 4-epimerase n=1 Tax=Sinanodonta woodiana TaxID=1069815 RepID=A0ABD3W5E9_SINWO